MDNVDQRSDWSFCAALSCPTLAMKTTKVVKGILMVKSQDCLVKS